MNVKTMIEWLSELPEDYEIRFSVYTSIVVEDEHFVVFDDPIIGMIKNIDNKELRFVTKSSEKRVLNDIEKGKKWKKWKKWED